MKILLAVDGSKPSLAAVDHLIQQSGEYRTKPQVELITVHLPVPKMRAVGKDQLAKYYEEEGESNLAPAKKKLDAAGIAYKASVLVGPIAETIVKHAGASRCDMICMGSRGMGEFGKALLGSTATKVLHLASQPLLIVK
ncbi:MAG TPA: universal stress protein [Burkholderiales bacterium]|nr:universal stress protein [Burkholderiales bacterium]